MSSLSSVLKFLAVAGKFILLVFLAALAKERIDAISVVVRNRSWSDILPLFQLALHLPLFWTGTLVPLVVVSALWSAADVLGLVARADRAAAGFLPTMKLLGYKLLLAAAMALTLVPSLENSILGGPHRLVYQVSLNYLIIAGIGIALIAWFGRSPKV